MVSAGPEPASALRLPRSLTLLLLCLTLIASAVGSAWAATAMAMPTAVASSSAVERSCHDTAPGLHADEDAGQPGPAAGCVDDDHCDCPQQGTVLLPAALPLLMGLPRSTAPLPTIAGRSSLAPDRRIRPPIA